MSDILPSLIISIAFFAESLFGFGGGLISIPLLSLLVGVRNAVTLVLIFQLLMGLLIIKTYKSTDWKVAHPLTSGLVIGTVLGIYALTSLSDILLQKFLAISILLFLIKMLFFKGFNFGSHTNKRWGFVAGFIGGIFQGVIGTGGPILTMYLSALSLGKTSFRSTLIYLFFITSIIRVIASITTQLFNAQIIFIAVGTLPFFLLAIFLGQKLHTKISEQQYQYAVEIILLFAAISLLLK